MLNNCSGSNNHQSNNNNNNAITIVTVITYERMEIRFETSNHEQMHKWNVGLHKHMTHTHTLIYTVTPITCHHLPIACIPKATQLPFCMHRTPLQTHRCTHTLQAASIGGALCVRLHRLIFRPPFASVPTNCATELLVVVHVYLIVLVLLWLVVIQYVWLLLLLCLLNAEKFYKQAMCACVYVSQHLC